MAAPDILTHNAEGKYRILVTKPLPGKRWRDILRQAGCRIDICTADRVLSETELAAAMGQRCDGVIGQLTETWNDALFVILARAGGKVYSNYAVGYDNVDIQAATRRGIAVGNTPGVLTATTAEMAVALTFAAARRLGEAERFMRGGHYKGWLPDLFLGSLLRNATLGVIGAGRIGSAYARMMVRGHHVNLVYFSRNANPDLEAHISAYNRFLEAEGETPVACRRAGSLEELLGESDVVSIHTVYNTTTHHLIDAERLASMKPGAVLINTSRGPVIDEAALVAHCRSHPDFRAGLDVFENEPAMATGLSELDNIVVVPHIASATHWTREGMAALAAANAAGVLKRRPVGGKTPIEAFLQGPLPEAAPSIVNANELGLVDGDMS